VVAKVSRARTAAIMVPTRVVATKLRSHTRVCRYRIVERRESLRPGKFVFRDGISGFAMQQLTIDSSSAHWHIDAQMGY
jgi:hypothetical protein